MTKYLVKVGYREFEFTDNAEALYFAQMALVHEVEKDNAVSIHLVEEKPEEDEAEGVAE